MAQAVAEKKVDAKVDANKEGATIWTGHEEANKKAVAFLEEFGLPLGLLPLADIVELGYVKETGYLWITQKKKIEHTFKLASKLVSYATDIAGFIEKQHIKKLTGVKAKELLLWAPVSNISIGEDKTKILFKSFAGITKTFDVKVFAAGE